MARIGLLHTGIREDEKLLIAAAGKISSVDFQLIDLRKTVLDPLSFSKWKGYDLFLERSISTVKGNAAIEFLSNSGLKVINEKKIINICNDKFQTATILSSEKIPTVRSILAFSLEQAKEAVEILGGYPVVIKPRQGSWGRLLGKVNDEDALEGILEHKNYMGPEHGAFVIQEFVEKARGDIRAFVIGGETICAINRKSLHWITNTARGAEVFNYPVNDDLASLCSRASKAIGGGILAFDIFETPEGLKINEINHTMEFKNSEAPTGVDISGKILEYCLDQVSR